jgi:WD40 repeat protein
METERPSASYIVDVRPGLKSSLRRSRPLIAFFFVQVLPPLARVHSPADTIPVRHLHQSIGKSKKPITVVRWTPEGRRLLTGGHTGEFMLWNGTAFNFETVMDVCLSFILTHSYASVCDLIGTFLTTEIGTLRSTTSRRYFTGMVPQP